jgi:hypothetical protein
MKLNKTTFVSLIVGILFILSNLGSCYGGKKSVKCGTSTVTKTDTVFIVDTDTFNIKEAGKTKYVPFVDSFLVADQKQLDSLSQLYGALIQQKEMELEQYRKVIEALKKAKPGDEMVIEFPHYVVTGESLSKDGSAKIKWSITVRNKDAIVPGDSLNPNPSFFVENVVPVSFEQTTTTTGKRNAVGFGAVLSSNGKSLNGMPVVKLRLGKTEYLGGYDPFGKVYLIGVVREIPFGK